MTHALAIDIGGTKLAAAVVTHTGEIVSEASAPTTGDGPDGLFSTLETVVRDVVSSSPSAPRVCGVGSGGPMTPGGDRVSPLNITQWRDFPLKERLAVSTGLEVHVDNDAKALALGEGWKGAARGHRNYLAMVVSTGVGGGIVLDGNLLDGEGGNAGHIGHVIVVPDGPVCGCGARGCLEAVASGTGIERLTGSPAADAPEEVRRRTGHLVGLAVASVANLLDLPLAVVAGSVALGFGEVFFSAAQSAIVDHSRLRFSVGTRIVPAGLGAAGPLVGAAAVGFRGAGLAGWNRAGGPPP